MGVLSRIQASLNALRNTPPSAAKGYTSDFKPTGRSLDVNATKMAFDTFSQPVWGPEISTHGAYSREGYTSKTFDKPYTPFKSQELALQQDEDVQLAINDLSSKITGSDHYWKAMDDQASVYMTDFTKKIDFDIIDTTMTKELLWFGNTVWKPRLGIQYLRSIDDLMHIPISSFQRIWWDRQRIPYKYEFRGPEYQGYHNPDDIIHILWNPVNASAFGSGFGVTMTTTRDFEQITPGGPVASRLPSLVDRKYSTQLTMHVTERRYIPHNVYVMADSDADQRAAARADLINLSPGEDFVVGSATEVQELGSLQRAFNPTQWTELTMSPIFKALNDFRGKNAGESGHQYANAKTAAFLDEIGLASFPNTLIIQLMRKLFKPWFEANPLYSMNYGGGLVSMPWEECKYELNFGRIEKKNLDPAVLISFMQYGSSVGALPDPIEIRDIMEEAGVGLKKEYTASLANEYNNPMQMPSSLAMPDTQGNNFSTNADRQARPQDSPQYNDHDNPTNRFPPKFDPQPSDPRLNFTRKTEIRRKPFI